MHAPAPAIPVPPALATASPRRFPGGLPCRRALLLGVLAWAQAPAWAQGARTSAPVVPTAVAQAAAQAGAHQLEGTLQPLKQATLAAQIGGNVLALLVKPGDRVTAGQVLARIDERDTQAGVQRSEAGVAQAEAELHNARLQAERARTLSAQGFVSQAALDQASTQLQAAQAGLRQAQAGRQQATLARGFAVVTAPFDAVVLATHVDAGDLAAAGRPVATVYQPGALRAVVQVPASLAASARQATDVQVLLPGGQRVVPVQRQLLPGADAVSQTVEWRLALPPAAADAAALPGQAVQVQWAAGAAPAPGAAPQGGPVPLLLPAAAVLRRGELTAVYVADQGRFVLRAVRTGPAQAGGGVPVLAGLKPGERYALDAVAAGLAGAQASK